MGHEGGGSKPPTPSPRNAPALVEHSRWETILELVDKHECGDDDNTERFKSKMKECVEAWRSNKDTHTEVVLENCYMGDGGGEIVGRVLECNPPLTKLNLRNNGIGDAGATAIGAALEKNTSIMVLNLDDNGIGDEGATAIGAALEKNTSITVLFLNQNGIGAAGATAIGAALEKNTSITELNLFKNRIGDEGATAIGAALEKNTSITVLYLDGNRIRAAGATAIGAALEKNTSITKLDLHNNGIGDEGATAIGAALEKNTSITVLYLNQNGIGAEGATAIGAALEKNTSITVLNLKSNGIGDAGATAIGAALEKNTSITKLNLGGNGIRDKGATAIGAALEKNTSITVLYLDNNWIGAAGATAIGAALEKNTSITELNLNYNFIGDKGATAIGAALEKNTSITELNLYDNRIGDEGATAIGAALEKNTSITVLNLDRNGIGAAGATAIAEALKMNPTIETLRMSPGLGEVLKDTLPPEIAAKNNDEVLAFLRDLRGSAPPADNVKCGGDEVNRGAVRVTRGKLLVVGPGGAGKSTLVRVLGGAAFAQDAVRSTDGMVVGSMSLPLENGDSIELSTWDFAGQEVYQTTHSLFLSTRCVYVLVWNMQAGMSQASFVQYLHSIHVKAPNAPVVIVGTHSDAMSDASPVDENDLKATHDGVVGSFSVSCSKGTGISDLRAFVAKTCAQQPNVRMEVPRPYLRVQTRLTEMVVGGGADIMGRDELIKTLTLDRSLGLESEDMTRNALSLLHAWGHVLAYGVTDKDSAHPLRDYIVTRPQWLADVMSCIVTGEANKSRYFDRGVMEHSALDVLWGSLAPELRSPLLEMMTQMEIVLPMRGREEEMSLVPAMLPTLAPANLPEAVLEAAGPAVENTSMMTLTLAYLPFDLVPRLIHRCQRYAEPTMCWRMGLAVIAGDTRGLITCGLNAQSAAEISITTRGPGRTRLRCVLKATLDTLIRKEYPGLHGDGKIQVRCGRCKEALPMKHIKKALGKGETTIDCAGEDCEDELEIADLLPGALVMPHTDYDAEISRLKPKPLETSYDERARRHQQFINEYARPWGEGPAAGMTDPTHPVLWLPVVSGASADTPVTAEDLEGSSGRKVAIHVLCEYPGEWHPLPGAHYDPGVETWNIAALKPRAAHLMRLVRLIARVGMCSEETSLLGLAVSDVEYCAQLEAAMAEFLKRNASDDDADGVEPKVDVPCRHGSGEVEEAVAEGLKRCEVRDGRPRWLCRATHENEARVDFDGYAAVARGGRREKGESLKSKLQRPAVGETGAMYGVVIGINAYSHDGIDDLSCAEEDAMRMTEVLQAKKFSVPESLRLVGSAATREAVVTALTKTLGETVKDNDRIVIFFAGHGKSISHNDKTKSGYLMLYDTNPNDLEATALDMEFISRYCSRLRAHHAMVILDCCHSGFATFTGRNVSDVPKGGGERGRDGIVEEEVLGGAVVPGLDRGH